MKLNRKGMTLVEVTVALVISSMVMITLVGLILSYSSLTTEIATSSDRLVYATDLLGTITRELKYAKNISIREYPVIRENYKYFTVFNGKLYTGKGESPSTAGDFGDIEMAVKSLTPDIPYPPDAYKTGQIFISIRIMSQDNTAVLFETNMTVKTRGLALFGNVIDSEIDKVYINPVISYQYES